MEKSDVVSGFFWKFLERCGAQGITLVVSLILARLLEPEAYGTISLIMVFLNIMEVFVDCGFGSALIQKMDADNVDFSTVFYANVIFSVILFFILFFSAPKIAAFYEMEELASYIRALSFLLIIAALKNVQVAYVSRNLLFRKFFVATLVGTIMSGIAGIALAYLGFGVWALVAQYLVNHFFDTLMLWILVRWRPSASFSFVRFKTLFSFSGKLLATSLIDTVYQKIRQLFIGKLYSTNELAYYNQGQQLPYAVISNLNTTLDSVIFPTFSSCQDNLEKIKELTRKSIIVGTYVITPMLFGMLAISEPLIRVVLTEKWMPAVFFMQMACISYAFTPINTANLNAVKALGRSDVVLKLEVIKKTCGLIILLVTVFNGVKIIAIGLVVSAFIDQVLNSTVNRKLINYGFLEQLKDILPSVLLSAVMAGLVYCVRFLNLGDAITIVLQVLFGIALYVIGSFVFKMEGFSYIVDVFKTYRVRLTRRK